MPITRGLRSMFVLILFFSFPALASAEIPTLIKEWLEHQEKQGDIQIKFNQTKSGGALAKPVTTSGLLWRDQQGRFRWQVGDPVQSVLVHNGKDLLLFDSSKNKWQELEANSQQFRHLIAILGNSSSDASILEKDFRITLSHRKSHVHTFALKPTSRRLKKHLRQIDLQINPTTKDLLQLRVIQVRGQTTLATFQKPGKVKTDPAMFGVEE